MSLPTEPALVRLNPSGRKPPIFLIHPVGGSIFSYMEFYKALNNQWQLYGFQMPALYDQQSPLPRQIQTMAGNYRSEIERLGVEEYILIGWSMGGILAFEMATQAHLKNHPPQRVILIDSWIPASQTSTGEIVDDRSLLTMVALDMGFKREQMQADLQFSDLKLGLQALLTLGKQQGLLPASIREEDFLYRFKILKNNFEAIANYRKPDTPYPGPFSVFRAEYHFSTVPSLSWEPLLDSPETIVLPGDHYTLLKAPLVHEMVRRILETIS